MTAIGVDMAQPGAERTVELLNAKAVAQRYFNGAVSGEWVLKNVPGRRRLGHRTVLWLASDVEAWIKYGTPNAE